MRQEEVGSLLVSCSPLGILTDRDLRNRVLAENLGASTAVAAVMSQPVASLDAGATWADAVLLMVEKGIRHLPLTENGEVVGLVSWSDLLKAQARDPLALLHRLETGGTPPGAYAAEVREVVRHLREGGAGALRIGSLVAALNGALVRRVLARTEQELGPAPLHYAFLVYGSDGRREQIWPTDQDNALVWADPPPDAAAEARRYFENFAGRVVAGLIAEGLPECPGGFMATRWRFPLGEAVATFRAFFEEARAETVLEACSLLDFRMAGGRLDIGPLENVRSEAPRARHFLRLLAADAARWSLPLGWLGGLREKERGFDLKRGILLIVSVARLFALEAGSPAVGTLERLKDAASTLGADDAATLAEAFRFLVELRLDEQLSGHGEGSRVRLAALNAMERAFLKDAFGFLQRLQESLPQRFGL